MLQPGTRFTVEKGNQRLNLHMHQTGEVIEVEDLGSDYSHYVEVKCLIAGRQRTFRTRYIKRVEDPDRKDYRFNHADGINHADIRVNPLSQARHEEARYVVNP